jgi:hypothetical protein
MKGAVTALCSDVDLYRMVGTWTLISGTREGGRSVKDGNS